MSASRRAIKLFASRHRGPDDGACVMELASMLAGEPFGDHPATICRVIAGFLSSYNDHVDEDRRQDVYAYAPRVVGTRPDAATERARAEIYRRWLGTPLTPRRSARASSAGCSVARASTWAGCTRPVPRSQRTPGTLPVAAPWNQSIS